MEPAGSDLDGDYRQEFPHGPLLADLFGWSPGAENLSCDLREAKGKLTFQWQRKAIGRNLKNPVLFYGNPTYLSCLKADGEEGSVQGKTLPVAVLDFCSAQPYFLFVFDNVYLILLAFH